LKLAEAKMPIFTASALKAIALRARAVNTLTINCFTVCGIMEDNSLRKGIPMSDAGVQGINRNAVIVCFYEQ